jgi:hypothetical protein
MSRTTDGRPLRTLVIIDEYTRECLSMYVSRRISSRDVLDQLYGLFISRGVEEQVEHFRSRTLEEEYPFLWIDAHYDKVRVEDRVTALALLIAHGVNGSGMREILAVEPMFDESEDSWREFFRKLKKRGLRRVCLCVSDAHAGI